MSIKREPSGRRSIQVEVEVPGTPEEVWRAIATGEGVSAWFVPTKMDNHAGGTVTSTFGPGMDATANITAWQEGKSFTAEGDAGAPGSPTMATEWFVEARGNGKCIVRVVHSLFASTDDWDNQLDGLEQGWPAYFRVLRMYLENYKGLACSAYQLVGFSTDTEAEAWQKAGGDLGLLNAKVGQKWAAPSQFPRMAGTIDSLGQGMHANTILLRLDSPAPGTAYVGAFSCAGMIMVCFSVYLYGEDARAAMDRDEPAWQAWMAGRFPMPTGGVRASALNWVQTIPTRATDHMS